MSTWKRVLPLALAPLCWSLPVDAEAGWRARAQGFEAQAQQVAERREQQRAMERRDQAAAPADAQGSLEAGQGLQVEGRPALVLSRDQLASAQDMGVVNETQIRWLEPKASALPPNPQATTDFTAYTLEPGELKVGLLSVGVGVLPNIQITSMPALYYAGLPNLSAKVNALHVGPLDIAITGNRTWLSQPGFESAITGGGAIASLRIAPAWSIHGGVSYVGLSAKGTPDLCSISPLLTDNVDIGLCDEPRSEPVAVESGSAFGIDGNDLYGELMMVRAATDIRFNRRDSIILQASAVPFARVQLNEDIEVPDIAQLDQVLSFDGKVPVSAAYMASIAYQMAWKNVHLRVGVGTSSLPLAWLTQTTELSMHFGGKDNWQRAKQKRAWRQNRRAAKHGVHDAEALASNQR
jgi:hypothetical protein